MAELGTRGTDPRRACARSVPSFASFWFEKDAARAVKELGEDNVLFETDFPHPTCLYPNVREHVEASLAGLSEQAMRKVLYENAARVYQLPMPA